MNGISDNVTESSTYSSTNPYASSLSPLVTWVSVVSFSIPTIVGSILYTFIFIVVLKNRPQFSTPYYKYLLSIGVGEILWLHYYGTFGSVCIAYGECPMSRDVNRVITSVGGWLVYYVEFTGNLAIAIDRFVAVCFFNYYEQLFTPKRAIIGAILIWVFAVPISLPVIVWIIPSSYYVEQMQDYFDYNNEATTLFNDVSTYIEFGFMGLCAVLYLSCVLFLGWHRVHSVSQTGSGMRRAHRNLMIQGLLHFLLPLTYDVLWLLLNANDVWVSYASCLIVQLIPLNTTIVTMVMNEAVRTHVRILLSCHHRETNVVRILDRSTMVVKPTASVAVSRRELHSARYPVSGGLAIVDI